MDLSTKKILSVKVENEVFEQIKNGAQQTIKVDYNKKWSEKFAYPCGTFKEYDLIAIQNQDLQNISELIHDFKGVVLIKEKSGWLKTKKHFEIKFGEIVSE